MPTPEYLALRAKVDSFTATVAARRDDLTCHAGCTACCQVDLEVCDVEADALTGALRALPRAAREALAGRLDRHGPCVLLDEDGRCAAYAARPLVCRTQGLPLRYPPDTVPLETVRGRVEDGEVTWCPLNFEATPPAPDEVLDAERVDLMLALINRRDSADPLRRTALRELVRRAVEADAR